MNDVIPNRSVFGRPFKPVALGVTILMIGLAAITAFDLGQGGRDAFDWFLSSVAAVSAGFLLTGWWKNDVRWTERGLAVATFAYLMRATYLIIVEPYDDSVLLAIGVLVIIAGSYVMESNDRRVKEWNQ